MPSGHETEIERSVETNTALNFEESIYIYTAPNSRRSFRSAQQPLCSENNEMVILEMSPALDHFRDTIVNRFNYEGIFLERLLTLNLQERHMMLLNTP